MVDVTLRYNVKDVIGGVPQTSLIEPTPSTSFCIKYIVHRILQAINVLRKLIYTVMTHHHARLGQLLLLEAHAIFETGPESRRRLQLILERWSEEAASPDARGATVRFALLFQGGRSMHNVYLERSIMGCARLVFGPY